MPSLLETRVRQRIGTMGLPGVVWLVTEAVGGGVEHVAFYDRERAVAYAAATPTRTMVHIPLRIRDAKA